MMPGGPLAKKQLTKLKIYKGNEHPHDIQKPKIINFDKINKKILLDNGKYKFKSKQTQKN